jgi:hypothetical protein
VGYRAGQEICKMKQLGTVEYKKKQILGKKNRRQSVFTRWHVAKIF